MAIPFETDLMRKGASPMSITLGFHLKRKGASPPVSARNLRFLNGRLAPFRFNLKRQTGR